MRKRLSVPNKTYKYIALPDTDFFEDFSVLFYKILLNSI